MNAQEMLLEDALSTAIQKEEENISLRKENLSLRSENRHLRKGYFLVFYAFAVLLLAQIAVILARM